MNVFWRLAYLVAVTLTLVLVPRDTPAQQPITPRDGQHDFDFEGTQPQLRGPSRTSRH